MKWKTVLNAPNFVATMAYAFNMTKYAMVRSHRIQLFGFN